MRYNRHLVILVIIIVIGFVVRFVGLEHVPNGLQQDETSLGYNAYSILKTGKDEYGNFLPLYFKAFGEYKLPFYIYLSVPSLLVFGVSEFGIRFVSAFFGSLSVIILYLLLKQIFNKERNYLLLATLFFALNPWHVHFSRGAFEVTPALFFLLLGTYFLLNFHKQRNNVYLFLSIIFWGFSIYTYNISRLLVPLLFFIVIYYLFKYNNNKKVVAGYTVISSCMLFPLVLTVFSNGGVGAVSSTILFFSNAVQAPLWELRSYVVDLPGWFSKLFFNSFFLNIVFYLTNIFSYFSVDYYFINGSLHGNHGIGTTGMFYFFEIITMSTGIYFLKKEHHQWMKLFIIWIGLIVGIAALTREAPHATRSFFLIPVLSIFSSYGCYILMQKILLISHRVYRIITFFVAFGIVGYCIVYYFTFYFVRFPVFYAKAWRSEDKSLSYFIEKEKPFYRKIIIDNKSGFIYSSYLFYTQYSPQSFQDLAQRYADDSEGFSRVSKLDTLEFREINWQKDLQEKNVLLITSASAKPMGVTIYHTEYYPERPVVLSVSEIISQFPIKEEAYVAIKTQ